jgi:hypothetical protein
MREVSGTRMNPYIGIKRKIGSLKKNSSKCALPRMCIQQKSQVNKRLLSAPLKVYKTDPEPTLRLRVKHRVQSIQSDQQANQNRDEEARIPKNPREQRKDVVAHLQRGFGQYNRKDACDAKFKTYKNIQEKRCIFLQEAQPIFNDL